MVLWENYSLKPINNCLRLYWCAFTSTVFVFLTLTLDAHVLLVLNDEVLLALLQLPQLVLSFLRGHSELLEGLVDLLVAL